MKCNTCDNYYCDSSGVDEGLAKCCKADMCREEKQYIMDNYISCKKYKKIKLTK